MTFGLSIASMFGEKTEHTWRWLGANNLQRLITERASTVSF